MTEIIFEITSIGYIYEYLLLLPPRFSISISLYCFRSQDLKLNNFISSERGSIVHFKDSYHCSQRIDGEKSFKS